MERAEIQKKIETIIEASIPNFNAEVSESLTPSEVSGWDSLANAMIITAVQNEFGIKFKFAELMAWHNVGQLIDIIEKKLS